MRAVRYVEMNGFRVPVFVLHESKAWIDVVPESSRIEGRAERAWTGRWVKRLPAHRVKDGIPAIRWWWNS